MVEMGVVGPMTLSLREEGSGLAPQKRAAVDVQKLPRGVRGVLGGEEYDRSRDVIEHPCAAEQRACAQALVAFRRHSVTEDSVPST
jgi:hypothetical protein